VYNVRELMYSDIWICLYVHS